MYSIDLHGTSRNVRKELTHALLCKVLEGADTFQLVLCTDLWLCLLFCETYPIALEAELQIYFDARTAESVRLYT